MGMGMHRCKTGTRHNRRGHEKSASPSGLSASGPGLTGSVACLLLCAEKSRQCWVGSPGQAQERAGGRGCPSGKTEALEQASRRVLQPGTILECHAGEARGSGSWDDAVPASQQVLGVELRVES